MQKILIAEDSKTQAIKLKLLLETNGFNSSVVENGREALQILSEQEFDLIISDIVMPEMNGFDLCIGIKSDDKYKSIPIILLTSLDNIEDVMRGLAVGADNYISKPYDDSYLISKIKEVLTNEPQKNYSINNTDLKVQLGNEDFRIHADPNKILNYFITSYEASVTINRALQKSKDKINDLNNNLEKRVEQRTLELQLEIESHKKTMGELQKALEKSQKLDMLKTEFLHNLSHEIRTPMNAISGFAQLLKDPDMNENDPIEFLPHISSSVDRLLFIINDMLEAAETVSETVDLEKSFTNFKCVFADLNKKYNAICKNEDKHIKINYSIDPLLEDQRILTYVDKTITILDKLLSNAVKFTDEGSIEFGVKLQADKLAFYVNDTGMGIKKESFDEIFECFKQLEDDHKIKYQGTGVGLTIAKKLIELMGGEIWLKSAPNQGCKFNFTLPIFGEQFKEPLIVDKTAKRMVDLNNLTILLAEDFESNYHLIKVITERKNIKLIWAKNGKEAVNLFEKYNEQIDLILMDIHMPIMDGFEAAKIIKKKYPKTLIIALTAYDSDFKSDNNNGSAMRSKIKEKGFDAVIQKPINPNRLLEIIKNELIQVD